MNNEILMAGLAVANLVMVLLAWRRTTRNDMRSSGALDEQTRTDLRYLMRGVDDIRIDVRALRQDISELDRRVVACEESTKSAHKRIDEHLAEHHHRHE